MLSHWASISCIIRGSQCLHLQGLVVQEEQLCYKTRYLCVGTERIECVCDSD